MSTPLLTINIPTMLTIEETAKALNENARKAGVKCGISKFYIRQLALTNKIVHTRAEKKILINFEKLIAYFNEAGVEADKSNLNKADNKYGITPISVK